MNLALPTFGNNSLFIGDLSKFCTEAELENLFTGFGQILDVKIKRNNNTGKTLSYGFVTFANEEIANNAMKSLDGTLFCGRKLRLRWAMYNAKSQNPINEAVINSVYVRFVTPRLDGFVTEEDLHNVFDSYGSVLDVSIKESSVDKRTNRQSGYGFVHFSADRQGVECAFHAVSAVDNATINGVTYYVELSKNLLKQFNDLRRADGGTQMASAHLPMTPGSMMGQQQGQYGGGGGVGGGGYISPYHNSHLPQFNPSLLQPDHSVGMGGPYVQSGFNQQFRAGGMPPQHMTSPLMMQGMLPGPFGGFQQQHGGGLVGPQADYMRFAQHQQQGPVFQPQHLQQHRDMSTMMLPHHQQQQLQQHGDFSVAHAFYPHQQPQQQQQQQYFSPPQLMPQQQQMMMQADFQRGYGHIGGTRAPFQKDGPSQQHQQQHVAPLLQATSSAQQQQQLPLQQRTLNNGSSLVNNSSNAQQFSSQPSLDADPLRSIVHHQRGGSRGSGELSSLLISPPSADASSPRQTASLNQSQQQTAVQQRLSPLVSSDQNGHSNSNYSITSSAGFTTTDSTPHSAPNSLEGKGSLSRGGGAFNFDGGSFSGRYPPSNSIQIPTINSRPTSFSLQLPPSPAGHRRTLSNPQQPFSVDQLAQQLYSDAQDSSEEKVPRKDSSDYSASSCDSADDDDGFSGIASPRRITPRESSRIRSTSGAAAEMTTRPPFGSAQKQTMIGSSPRTYDSFHMQQQQALDFSGSALTVPGKHRRAQSEQLGSTDLDCLRFDGLTLSTPSTVRGNSGSSSLDLVSVSGGHNRRGGGGSLGSYLDLLSSGAGSEDAAALNQFSSEIKSLSAGSPPDGISGSTGKSIVPTDGRQGNIELPTAEFALSSQLSPPTTPRDYAKLFVSSLSSMDGGRTLSCSI